jgi:hypothetical protein
MTKQQAREVYVETMLPGVIAAHGCTDEPALCQDWNDWTDFLCKDGQITSKQYASWVMPKFTRGEYLRAAEIASNRE